MRGMVLARPAMQKTVAGRRRVFSLEVVGI